MAFPNSIKPVVGSTWLYPLSPHPHQVMDTHTFSLCVGLITSVLAASGMNNMWPVTVPNLEQKGCALADERARAKVRLKVESF